MAWTTPTAPATGDVLTATKYTNEVVNNGLALYQSKIRLGIQTRTSDYSTTATTIAAASNIFTSSITWTATAATAYIIEFFCSRVEAPGTATAYTSVNLVDSGGTGITMLGLVQSAAAAVTSAPMLVRYRYTPGAGSITINARGTVSGGTGVIHGGSGGTAVLSYPPAYLAVYGPDIT